MFEVASLGLCIKKEVLTWLLKMFRHGFLSFDVLKFPDSPPSFNVLSAGQGISVNLD